MNYIGIDIGGTSIKGGIVDEKGNINIRFRFKFTKGDQEATIKELGEAINKALADNNLSKDDFVGVGVGAPGSINADTGICDFANNLGWNNLDIAGILKKTTGLPVRVNNDANCAMAGEAKFGIGKEYKNLILLTLGTGVGGGIYINGKLYAGNEGKGGELGHMIIDFHGNDCSCGLKGCFETYASVSALIRQTKKAMELNPFSSMWKFVDGDIDKVDGRTAFECSKEGDEAAIEVVNKYEDYLTVGCINMCNIFRPDAIILGGGLSGQKEYLTDAIEKRLAEAHYGYIGAKPVKVLVSSLGNDAGILGAAALFID